MKFVIVMSCLLFATTAWAVADPDPNQIGVYFDAGADVNYLDVPAGQSFTAYVILTNPTEPVVSFAEYRLEIIVHGDNPDAVIYSYVSDPCADGCIWGGACGDQCMVDPADPFAADYLQGFIAWGHTLEAQPATILLQVGFWMIEETGVEFYLRPVESGWFSTLDVPSYGGEDQVPIPLGVSSGDMGLPVAAINTGAAPVATDRASWGAVKALYR